MKSKAIRESEVRYANETFYGLDLRSTLHSSTLLLPQCMKKVRRRADSHVILPHPAFRGGGPEEEEALTEHC